MNSNPTIHEQFGIEQSELTDLCFLPNKTTEQKERLSFLLKKYRTPTIFVGLRSV
ncbi:MAG: hypothetical protein ACFFKA_05825 [Candidatus Thorarchaeota archaeon]